MLKVADLSVNYGDKQVLNQLNQQFEPGEIHGVLGMNGAGKTTFFNTLYQNIQPVSGVLSLGDSQLQRDHIAFLETQNYFYPYLKGREYLELITLSNPNFQIKLWNEIFELPLEELIDNYSTGMKKQLAFIGMLSSERPIFILDEPFNGVDVENNEKIHQILIRLKTQDKVILLSSHIINSLTAICDKISYLSNGRIQQSYQKEDYPLLEQTIKNMVKKQIDQKLDSLL